MILALDLGTKTGWAVRMPEGLILSGTQSFKLSRFDGNGMQFVRFREWIGEMLQRTQCRRVVYEEVRNHAGVDAAHAYGGYLAHLQARLQGTAVPFSATPVGTIKAFATGKGNASKEAVIAAMRARGFNPQDDNEADALALLLHTEAEEQSHGAAAAAAIGGQAA